MNARFFKIALTSLFAMVLLPLASFGNVGSSTVAIPSLFGIRVEFILFALTLIGVALFHHKTMHVALTGLAAVLVFKLIFDADFSLLHHIVGGGEHEGEWRILLNLVGLLFGFGILAKYFEESGVPDVLPKYLPNDWKGGIVLLGLVFVMSAFLDNIAAAMIGGTIAYVVYKGKVHIGFLAAIIAASNAGGAGSVVGDTTTTLMWIDGVNPMDVTHAFVASIAAFLIFGVVGALQQHKYQPIQADATIGTKVDTVKLLIVFLILISAILTNWLLDFPAVGVWVAILLGNFIRKAHWAELKSSWQGTIFLTALVTCASLMPVSELPAASWQTAFSLGFVSAVFDNIPLTKLCLDQGHYDWGVLAYAVGFGGSMIWFGSSAGVALTNKFPEARSVVNYVRHGWHVIIAYVVGFFALYYILGWQPHEPHRTEHQVPATEQVVE